MCQSPITFCPCVVVLGVYLKITHFNWYFNAFVIVNAAKGPSKLFYSKCPRNHMLTFRGSTSEVLSYPACTQAFLPSYLKVKLEKSRIINFLVRIFLSKKNFSRAWQEVAVLLKLLAALETHCQKMTPSSSHTFDLTQVFKKMIWNQELLGKFWNG